MTESAVLLDVDGTLYRQAPLRAAMALELGVSPLRGMPGSALTTWRVLKVFRQVREELRSAGRTASPLEDLQYDAAAERAGVDASLVRDTVREWILTRPLRYLGVCRRPAVEEALQSLVRERIPVGVFSDYPADAKLDALGISRFVSLRLSATDESINAFKPHPRGFLAACEHWGVSPDRVVYVGDRPDVDAEGAAAAGMPCLIIGRRTDGNTFSALPSFHRLERSLVRLGERARHGPVAAQS